MGNPTLGEVAGFTTDQLDALFALGQRALDSGRLDQADAAFGVLLTLSPRQARGWRGMGETRLKFGDWTGSLSCFTTALGLDDQDAASFAMRATALVELGRLRMAREDLDICLTACERQGLLAKPWREYAERLLDLVDKGAQS